MFHTQRNVTTWGFRTGRRITRAIRTRWQLELSGFLPIIPQSPENPLRVPGFTSPLKPAGMGILYSAKRPIISVLKSSLNFPRDLRSNQARTDWIPWTTAIKNHDMNVTLVYEMVWAQPSPPPPVDCLVSIDTLCYLYLEKHWPFIASLCFWQPWVRALCLQRPREICSVPGKPLKGDSYMIHLNLQLRDSPHTSPTSDILDLRCGNSSCRDKGKHVPSIDRFLMTLLFNLPQSSLTFRLCGTLCVHFCPGER